MRCLISALLAASISTPIISYSQVQEDRDPTQPINYGATVEPGEKISTTGKLELKSILFSKNRRVALINSTYVSVGEKIGSAKVITIEKGSVTLSDSGREFTLYLFEHTIRK